MPRVVKRQKHETVKSDEEKQGVSLSSGLPPVIKSEPPSNSWLSGLSSSQSTSSGATSLPVSSASRRTTRSSTLTPSLTSSLHTSSTDTAPLKYEDVSSLPVKSEPTDIEDIVAPPLPTQSSTTSAPRPISSKLPKSWTNPPGKHSQPPPHFEEMYQLIKEMRAPGGAAANAAVDTMGCSMLGNRAADPRTFRFQTLVSLMLSAQTKDTVTAAAMAQLKARVADNCSAQGILDTDPDVIHDCIRQVGFHNNKLKYILAAARICVDEYGGDIPDSIEGLCKLAGVGPKMAHLTMQVAWDRVEGIGVDVHVHRLCNMWGWVKTKTPEQTRVALESWLPRDRWSEINHLLVGFGQTVCPSQRPHCRDCLLAYSMLCPASTIKKEMREKLRREGKLKLEEIEAEAVATTVMDMATTKAEKTDRDRDGEDEDGYALPSLEEVEKSVKVEGDGDSIKK